LSRRKLFHLSLFELHPVEIALQFIVLLLESRLFLLKHFHLLSHARDFELLALHHGLDDEPIRANRGQDDGDHAGHQPARANLGLIDRASDRCLGSPFQLLLELRYVRLRLSFEFRAKPGFEGLKRATILGFLLSPCLGQGLLLGLPSCFFLFLTPSPRLGFSSPLRLERRLDPRFLVCRDACFF
jgi:hypothetical protein